MLKFNHVSLNLPRADGVFGYEQWLPFSFIEKLPHFPSYAPSPFMLSHVSLYYYPIAWHNHFPVVHLHSQPYRMLRAISTNNLDEITTLLDNGFPINSKLEQKYGFTAMQLAAINNHFPLLEILCLRGADPNLPDKWGNTPLLHAVTHRSHQAIHSLLRNGGDPSIRNKYGLSAIDKAEDAPSIRQFMRSFSEKNRKFPRFKVQLKLQKRLRNGFWDELKKKKQYKGKVRENPVSRWQFDFTDYKEAGSE